jgi:4-amino-4-deoxy-L-arabinose transferase-like glycosyltransferase
MSAPAQPAGARSARVVPVLLAVFILVALVVRLPWFDDALYGDEVQAFWDVSGRSLDDTLHLFAGYSTELSPPLFFVLAWVSGRLFGASAESLRIVSLAAGLATIPLTYVLGRWTLGVWAGLLGAAFVALSPFMIFYSCQARPYALMVMLCLVSTLALLRGVRGGGTRWWALYAAASCAAMYTHYTSVFLLAVQFGWALVTQPAARRPLLAANLAAAVGFGPWLPTLIEHSRSPGTGIYGLLEPFTFRNVRVDLGKLWFGSVNEPLSSVPGLLAAALAGGGLIVGIMMCLRRAAAGGLGAGWRRAKDTALVTVLALGVPLAIAVYSAVRPTVWTEQNLIASWPGFAVLAGAILTRGALASRTAGVAVRAAAVGAVLAAFVVGAVQGFDINRQRPDYDAIARYIADTGRGREPVVNQRDLSPGAVDSLDVAFAQLHESQGHPVVRLGVPPFRQILREPPFAQIPSAPGEEVARKAARLAGNGMLFVVLPTRVPPEALARARRQRMTSSPESSLLVKLVAFFATLPARFRLVDVYTTTGFNRATVYTYRG